MSTPNEYIVLGLMSGTSMDGLDMALCKFYTEKDTWKFAVLDAKTYEYSVAWKETLSNAPHLNGHDLLLLHNKYGLYTGQLVNGFLSSQSYKPELIASHGHTIFHQPEKNFTFQLGHGAIIAKETEIPVVSDFRTMDVIQGGQGAPLVPFGDRHLFTDYAACLNLGGFANITINDHPPIAFDICPVNIIINKITREIGLDYDKNGHLASKGKINQELLNQLNNISYYKQSPPKSLGNEWLQEYFLPVLESFNIERYDYLRTLYEHMAIQIANITNSQSLNNLLITGGGAKNNFLLKLLQDKSHVQIVLPDVNIIDFKEAIIFGYLGLMKWLNKPNIYASVTGGTRDICSGILYKY